MQLTVRIEQMDCLVRLLQDLTITLKKEYIMDKDFKTKIEPLIQTIANNANDQATKDAVAQLQTHVDSLDTSGAAVSARETELESAVGDIEDALTEVVNKLQAGDNAGALAAATTAQETASATTSGADSAPVADTSNKTS